VRQALMRADTVAAMENNDSPRGGGAEWQIKLGWSVTERRPNLGGIEDLCFRRSYRRAKQNEKE
jgi:hypothetical protein